MCRPAKHNGRAAKHNGRAAKCLIIVERQLITVERQSTIFVQSVSGSVYSATVLRRVIDSVGQREIWCWSTAEGSGYGIGEPQIY
ncbi:hypothetical protein HaLaN_27686, partial [Haematococcus lacustris]